MSSKLIVALDVDSFEEMRNIVEDIGDIVSTYKVGAQLYLNGGNDVIKYLKDKGKNVFLDLKFHDIPNTVSKAVEASVNLGVDMLTIHSLGGFEMMESAQKMVWERGMENRVKIFAVTILTSLDEAFLRDIIGVVERSLKEEVLHLATLAKSAGLNGVVASPYEVKDIKERCGKDFLVLTPGVRPEGFNPDDQARFRTPGEASRDGADYIIVGRPVLYAEDRKKMVNTIIDEIKNG